MAGPVEVRQRKNIARNTRPLTACNANDIDVSAIDSTDLSQLKEVSQRLNLSTRRPSTIEWKRVIDFRKSMGLYGSSDSVDFVNGISEVELDAQNLERTETPVRLQFSEMQGSFTSSEVDFETTKEATTTGMNTPSTRSQRLTNKAGVVGHRENTKKRPLSSIFKFKKRKHEHKEPASVTRKVCDTASGSPSAINTTNKPNEFKPCEIEDSALRQSIIESEDCTDEHKIGQYCVTDDEFDTGVRNGMSKVTVRYYNITRALEKIRRDLITMRIEDNQLAQRLLVTRSQMNMLKLTKSCDEHAEMLDDAAFELEEEDMLPGLIKACDLPNRPPHSLFAAFSPLRDIGVSRMNLNRRRFSIR